MLDGSTSPPVPKQIEMNLIAASYGGLGSRLRDYHRHLLQLMGCGDVSERVSSAFCLIPKIFPKEP